MCKSIIRSCGVLVQVAAACLYIVCRQDEKPYMLIDFSDALQVSACKIVLHVHQVTAVVAHAAADPTLFEAEPLTLVHPTGQRLRVGLGVPAAGAAAAAARPAHLPAVRCKDHPAVPVHTHESTPCILPYHLY